MEGLRKGKKVNYCIDDNDDDFGDDDYNPNCGYESEDDEINEDEDYAPDELMFESGNKKKKQKVNLLESL